MEGAEAAGERLAMPYYSSSTGASLTMGASELYINGNRALHYSDPARMA